MKLKKLSILGSTGSIGVSSLDLISRHLERFSVIALAAGTNMTVLADQVNRFKPKLVSVKSDEERKQLLATLAYSDIEIMVGEAGNIAVATHPEVDTVISAIVGAKGLVPTLSAIQAGKTIALANKESMVIAGELMNQAAQTHHTTIIPVDSEHSALFQCLQGGKMLEVEKLILTASGGPFLHSSIQDLAHVTVDQALKHPNWDMGAKITIDSATMMNKGLEVMEAHFLFSMPIEKIEVCVHPQSIIHSMVAFCDGSVLAHLGVPDMRVPIGYALSYPDRIQTGVNQLDLFKQKELTFLAPDFKKFPCLQLSFDVASKGQSYPAVLNAANEVCVENFLKKKIRFLDIAKYVEEALSAHQPTKLTSVEAVLAADLWARNYVKKRLN